MPIYQFCNNIYDNVKVGDIVSVTHDEACLARYIIKKKKRTNKCLDVQNIKTGTTFKDVHANTFSYIDNMQWVACSRDKIYKMASVGDFLKQYYQSDTIYKIIANIQIVHLICWSSAEARLVICMA